MPEKTEHGDDVVVRDGRRFVRTPSGGEIPEERYLAMFAPPLVQAPRLPHVPELELMAAFVAKVIMGVPSESPGLQRLVTRELELTSQATDPKASMAMDPDARRARILAGRLEFMAQVLDIPGDERVKKELRDRVARTYAAFFGVKRGDSIRAASLAITVAVETGAIARSLATTKQWPQLDADLLGVRLAKRCVWICEPELADRLDSRQLGHAVEYWLDGPGAKATGRGRRGVSDAERVEREQRQTKDGTPMGRKWRAVAELCKSVGLRGLTAGTLEKHHSRWLAEMGTFRREHDLWLGKHSPER